MSEMFLTVNEEPQLYDDRTLETMTLLAFAAQLTAAILYSSAVYCVLYNNCTVPYNNSTLHGAAAALLLEEHLDSARDICRVDNH